MHFGPDLVHRFNGTWGAGHNTGTQRFHIVFFKVRMCKHSDKHCRNTVYCGTLFFFNGLQRLKGIKRFQHNHCGPVVDAVQGTHNAPETVKQRHLNKETVLFSHTHDITNHPSVIDNIIMCQHDALRKSCGP